MAFTEIHLMDGMTSEQRLLFQSQYLAAKKDRTVGLLLTLFLGGVGGHRFYLGQVGLGVAYLVFCWTLIPGIIALVELFLIGKRVDGYNERQATEIAAQVTRLGSSDH